MCEHLGLLEQMRLLKLALTILDGLIYVLDGVIEVIQGHQGFTFHGKRQETHADGALSTCKGANWASRTRCSTALTFFRCASVAEPPRASAGTKPYISSCWSGPSDFSAGANIPSKSFS